MQATIKAIEYFLPEASLTNEELASSFPDWSIEKIERKTGIIKRHIAGPDELSSDLAVKAAQKLFYSGVCRREEIDFILLCTQTPDYFLPPSSCLIQKQLGIPVTAGALDFSLGCTGYIYGLCLAKGLVETGQAKSILFLTAETYSKFIHPEDRSLRTLFGDGATATLIQPNESIDKGSLPFMGPFVFGTDGQGANNLIVKNGGFRNPNNANYMSANAKNYRDDFLYMDGPEVFNFTLKEVPKCVEELLIKSSLKLEDIDWFVFHQANLYILEHLREKLKINPEKFVLAIKQSGNTVSSTIPIALKEANVQSKFKKNHKVMLVGFGLGYSWGQIYFDGIRLIK